jgi:hypothetical protein
VAPALRRRAIRPGGGGPVAERAAVVIGIGTCGWRYDHCQPELYAPGLPASERLARYAAAFATAELNSSFYRVSL